jgi:hypothetical protein
MSKLIKDFKLFESSVNKILRKKRLQQRKINSEYTLNDISQTLNDIFMEVKDEDITCRISTMSNTGFLVNIIDSNLKFLKGTKKVPEWFMECLRRTEDYMESNEFKTEYRLKQYTQRGSYYSDDIVSVDWVKLDSLEDLLKYNHLVFEINIKYLKI